VIENSECLQICGRNLWWSTSRYCPLAVSQLRFPIAEARLRSEVKSYGICGGQSGIGPGFLRVLRFPLPILIPPTAPHLSSTIRGWYNRPNSGRRTTWAQSHLTPKNEKKTLNYYPDIFLEALRKITKKTVRIFDVPAEFDTSRIQVWSVWSPYDPDSAFQTTDNLQCIVGIMNDQKKESSQMLMELVTPLFILNAL
jgi:hypothetical protein